MSSTAKVKKGSEVEEGYQQRVCFSLGGEIYCERAEVIQEILTWSTPTPVPGAPYAVQGILNVRGEIITVLNGRKLLGLPDIEPTEQWRIVTMDLPGGLFGISVEAVEEMVELAIATIEYPPATGGPATAADAMIAGTVQHNNRLLICTDLPQLCSALTEERE